MEFSLFNIWKFESSYGFVLLEISNDKENYINRSLLGFMWDKEDRILGIDFMWRYFEY